MADQTRNPWLNRVAAQVDEPGWLQSIDAQYATIAYIAEYTAKGANLGKLPDLVALRLGITEERLWAIVALDDYRDIRRALRARYSRPTPRDPEDRVYPHEGWIGAYLEFAQDSETPLAWHFWCASVLLGAALRNNLYIDRNLFYLTANEYLVMVGPQSAHKTTAITMATRILTELNNLLAAAAIKSGEDRSVVLLPNKVTPEGMIDALEPRTYIRTGVGEDGIKITRKASIGLQACEELMVLLGKSVHGADRLVGLLASLYGYDGKDYDFQGRLRGHVNLHLPTISVLWGSTADWINKSVTTEFFTGGFVGRCIWATRDRTSRSIPLGRPLDPVVRQSLAAMLAPWALCGMKEVELTADAETWFGHWYTGNREREMPMPLLDGWRERKQIHLLKLALVLTVSEWTQPGLTVDDANKAKIRIEPRHLEKALELLDLEEARMPDTFVRIGQHSDTQITDNLLALIRRLDKGEGVRYATILQRLRYSVGTADVLKKHLATLVDSSEIEKVAGLPGGTRYRILNSESGTA